MWPFHDPILNIDGSILICSDGTNKQRTYRAACNLSTYLCIELRPLGYPTLLWGSNGSHRCVGMETSVFASSKGTLTSGPVWCFTSPKQLWPSAGLCSLHSTTPVDFRDHGGALGILGFVMAITTGSVQVNWNVEIFMLYCYIYYSMCSGKLECWNLHALLLYIL